MSCEGLNKISISTCVRTFCRGCETCKSPRLLEIKRNKANLELRKDAVTHQIQELRIQADRALRQIPERSLNLRAIQAQIDQKDKDAAEECGDHRWWPAMRREDHQRSDHGYEWTHWTNVYFRRCACLSDQSGLEWLEDLKTFQGFVAELYQLEFAVLEFDA